MTEGSILDDLLEQKDSSHLILPEFKPVTLKISRNSIVNILSVFRETRNQKGSFMEVLLYGFGDRESDIIRHVILPRNSWENSSGYCLVKSDALAEAIEEAPEGLYEKSWIHSHPAGVTSPSGTDRGNNRTVLDCIRSYNFISGTAIETISGLANKLHDGIIEVHGERSEMDFAVPVDSMKNMMLAYLQELGLSGHSGRIDNELVSKVLGKTPYIGLIERRRDVLFVYGHSLIFHSPAFGDYSGENYFSTFCREGGHIDNQLAYSEMFSGLIDPKVNLYGLAKKHDPVKVPLEIVAVENDMPILPKDIVSKMVKQRVIDVHSRQFQIPKIPQPVAVVPDRVEVEKPKEESLAAVVVVDKPVHFYESLYRRAIGYVAHIVRRHS